MIRDLLRNTLFGLAAVVALIVAFFILITNGRR